MIYRWTLPLFLLTACGVYNNKFDCPPGKGIGCAPVGEVLDLIVEREEGEDLFVEDRGTALLLKQAEKPVRPARATRKKLVLLRDESGQLLLVNAPEEHSS